MGMRVDASATSGLTIEQRRRNEDRNLQGVFAEVLENVGRSGFESAESIESNEPLDQLVQSSWNSWYQIERLGGRYASAEAPHDLGQTYGSLLGRAYSEGGYVDPKAFLGSLSSSELQVVQNANWLADPIQVDSLSEEGALNLLLPMAAQVDINHDGLTQSGQAYGLRFPDSTTPREVVMAWDEATDGMPLRERMIYELQMKLPVMLANIQVDAEGRYVSTTEPGSPDFVNPMAASDYSYVQVTKDWIEHLDYFKNQIDPLRYQKDRSFWKSFQQSLVDQDAS